MTTDFAVTADESASKPRADPSPHRSVITDPDRRIILVVAATLAIPFGVAAVYALTHAWLPSSDQALIELRTWDTGTRLTPFVGPFSRLGWNHPGPLLFWILAVPYRLSGASSNGLLIGAVVINFASVAGCLVIARRLGGNALVLLTGLALAVLARSVGPSFLFSIWNPNLPVFPLAFLVLATWAIVEGWLELYPLAIITSCLAWQCHLGNLPVAGFLLGVATLAVIRGLVRPPATATRSGGRRRTIVVLAIVALTICLAPLAIDQLRRHPSNLELIIESFRHPVGEVAGMGRALSIGALHLAPNGAWISGFDPSGMFSGEAAGLTPWALLPTIVALGVAGVLGVRARRRTELRLLGLATATAVMGVIGISRTTGAAYPYLFNGLRAVAMSLWLAVAWTILRSLPLGMGRRATVEPSSAAPPQRAVPAGEPVGSRFLARVRRPVAVVTLIATLAVSVSTIWSASGLDVPDRGLAEAVDDLQGPVFAAVGDRSVFVHPTGSGCAIDVAAGLALQLVKRGNEIGVPDLLATGYGPTRVDRPSDVALRIVCGAEARSQVLESTTPPIATHDMLGPAESAELTGIEDHFRQQFSALGRDDLQPLVTSGELIFIGFSDVPGLVIEPGQLERYAQLIKAQQYAAAVFFE